MRTYLKSFRLPSNEYEEAFFESQRLTCFNTYYPFGVFKDMPKFEFSPVTIFYGGNGSGKSTILNVMAEYLKIKRLGISNTTRHMGEYVHGCKATKEKIPYDSIIITSDDVFNYLIDMRYLNVGIDAKREDLFAEYYKRPADMRLRSLADYEEYKKQVEKTRFSISKYVKNNLINNVKTVSNGESAVRFFTSQIDRDALYLLDEPENSLSAKNQILLKEFIESSVKGYGCQFVIATHSPFLLSIENATIYDLDDESKMKKWTDLENTKTYYEFFKNYSNEFENK